jgi:hypothetical protein
LFVEKLYPGSVVEDTYDCTESGHSECTYFTAFISIHQTIQRIDERHGSLRNKGSLLNFMESGYIKVDQMHKQYDFKINGAKVFAACNEITRLSRPLQSRFRRLHLPPYTEQQFLEVSVKVLPKLKIASVIGKAVWDQRGDIRDVISIGKLVRKNDGPEEVEQILSTMIKYGEM